MQSNNPEIGKSIATCGYSTNYHDMGSGQVILLLHGSGPGVSAWANWRGVAPALSEEFRVIMPDLVGFGYTQEANNFDYQFMDSWVEQVIALITELSLSKVTVVGNSFGGAVALALTIARPDLVDRLVLMGSVGVPVKITHELDKVVWGYKPSLESMKDVLNSMAYNRELVTDELAELRYQASIKDSIQTRFERLFPEPRQRWLDLCSSFMADISSIKQQTLIIHGRDDKVIPLSTSLQLHQLISASQLHVFGQCGHWTQIEHANRFIQLVTNFAKENCV